MTGFSNSSALDQVSEFASKSFSNTEDSLTALLDVAAQIIDFQTVLISEISTAKSELRIYAVKNRDPALTIPPGLQIPLTASPCQHVASSIKPLSVGDMHADAELAALPAAKDMGATAYVGVPIVLADGSFFGTLACLDIAAKAPSDEDIQWLQILARLAALEIQRERDLQSV